MELLSAGSSAAAWDNSRRKKIINITKEDAALLKAPHLNEYRIIT
jgi:hypothetical protein